MYDILELSKKLLPELREIAKELNIKRAETLKKQDLVYKILDQQAIEATEKKSAVRKTNDIIRLTDEKFSQDRDHGQRRGKRPRTSKPVINRQPESVISVSPDDLKRDNSSVEERPEPVKSSERTEEKPDLFKPVQPVATEEKKEPVWINDNKEIERKELSIVFDRRKDNESDQGIPETVPESVPESMPESVYDSIPESVPESVPESLPESIEDSSAPLINGDSPIEDIKPAEEPYQREIIVEPIVVPEVIPVKEEKRERPYEFEGMNI